MAFYFVFVFKWLSYENNKHKEDTIKMYIAYINLLSFDTFSIIVASIVLQQQFCKKSENTLIKRRRLQAANIYVPSTFFSCVKPVV